MSPALPRPAELRAIALDAARAVVGDLAAAFRSPTAIGPEAKTTHHDLVTVHDRHTEARLVAALTTAVPGSGVLGEELGAQAGMIGAADMARSAARRSRRGRARQAKRDATGRHDVLRPTSRPRRDVHRRAPR